MPHLRASMETLNRKLIKKEEVTIELNHSQHARYVWDTSLLEQSKVCPQHTWHRKLMSLAYTQYKSHVELNVCKKRLNIIIDNMKLTMGQVFLNG